MKSIGLVFGMAVALATAASSAHAIPRTFVSGTGGGAACTRAAPCATFQAAHDVTDLGGEIDCVDAGSYGGVVITKSITIDCTGTLGVAGQISVNAPNVTVRLRNLTIDTSANPLIGVFFGNGSTVFIEHCVLAGTTQAIVASPQAFTGRLFVTDTIISGSSVQGIRVAPTGSGSVRATIDGGRIEKNNFDGLIVLEDSSTTGPSLIHMRNTVVTENSTNVGAFGSSGTGIISITVDRSSLTFSSGDGIATDGAAFIVLGRSTVMSNVVGLHTNNGQIFTYKNNHLSGNVTDAKCDPAACTLPPTAALTLK